MDSDQKQSFIDICILIVISFMLLYAIKLLY